MFRPFPTYSRAVNDAVPSLVGCPQRGSTFDRPFLSIQSSVGWFLLSIDSPPTFGLRLDWGAGEGGGVGLCTLCTYVELCCHGRKAPVDGRKSDIPGGQ